MTLLFVKNILTNTFQKPVCGDICISNWYLPKNFVRKYIFNGDTITQTPVRGLTY